MENWQSGSCRCKSTGRFRKEYWYPIQESRINCSYHNHSTSSKGHSYCASWRRRLVQQTFSSMEEGVFHVPWNSILQIYSSQSAHVRMQTWKDIGQSVSEMVEFYDAVMNVSWVSYLCLHGCPGICCFPSNFNSLTSSMIFSEFHQVWTFSMICVRTFSIRFCFASNWNLLFLPFLLLDLEHERQYVNWCLIDCYDCFIQLLFLTNVPDDLGYRWRISEFVTNYTWIHSRTVPHSPDSR